jgi:hypothetical protein
MTDSAKPDVRTSPAAEERRQSASTWSAATFLILLIGLLAASPLFDDFAYGELVEAVLLTAVLVSAIPAVGGRRRTTLVALLLSIPAIAGKWLHHFRPEAFRHEWFLIAAVVFSIFVLVHHLGFILRSAVVDAQVLCAGVSTFLMLGLLWSFAYLLLSAFQPGAISMELTPGDREPLSGFGALYLSYATLSGAYCPDVTVGSNAARMLAVTEGMTAMFYVAILIARLVALYSERPASQ